MIKYKLKKALLYNFSLSEIGKKTNMGRGGVHWHVQNTLTKKDREMIKARRKAIIDNIFES